MSDKSVPSSEDQVKKVVHLLEAWKGKGLSFPTEREFVTALAKDLLSNGLQVGQVPYVTQCFHEWLDSAAAKQNVELGEQLETQTRRADAAVGDANDAERKLKQRNEQILSMRRELHALVPEGYSDPDKDHPDQLPPTKKPYDQFLLPFMEMMRTELAANSHKGDRAGWLSMGDRECLLELYYHLGKLQKAVRDDQPVHIVEHAADVANMSMMLLDICKLLVKEASDE